MEKKIRQMTDYEIVQSFTGAAKPVQQIGILAELNDCTKKEIAAILIEAGCENVPKWYLKKETPEAGRQPEEDAPLRSEADAQYVTLTGPQDDAITEEPRFVNADALWLMLSSIEDMDDLKDMSVIVNGKKIGSANITGWWNERTRRISWILDLTAV